MGARESGKRSGIDARINSKMGVRHSGRAAEGGRLVGRKSAAWSGGGRPLGRRRTAAWSAEDGRLVGRRSAARSAEDGRSVGRRKISASVLRVFQRRASHGAQVIKQALPQHAARRCCGGRHGAQPINTAPCAMAIKTIQVKAAPPARLTPPIVSVFALLTLSASDAKNRGLCQRSAKVKKYFEIFVISY